jgi:hydroxypyruvate isomerase
MPRFCANISMLFAELPMLERPAAARAAGFDAVEVQFPYTVPLDDFARAIDDAGVAVALINFPAGNADKGDRGLGALPSRKDEFRAGVAEAKRYAKRLHVERFNLLAGVP